MANGMYYNSSTNIRRTIMRSNWGYSDKVKKRVDISQEEIDKAKAEFEAKGGQPKRITQEMVEKAGMLHRRLHKAWRGASHGEKATGIQAKVEE